MLKNPETCPTEAAAINQAGMTEPVDNNEALGSHHRRNDAGIGGVSRVKGQGSFGSFKLSNGGFQFLMFATLFLLEYAGFKNEHQSLADSESLFCYTF